MAEENVLFSLLKNGGKTIPGNNQQQSPANSNGAAQTYQLNFDRNLSNPLLAFNKTTTNTSYPNPNNYQLNPVNRANQPNLVNQQEQPTFNKELTLQKIQELTDQMEALKRSYVSGQGQNLGIIAAFNPEYAATIAPAMSREDYEAQMAELQRQKSSLEGEIESQAYKELFQRMSLSTVKKAQETLEMMKDDDWYSLLRRSNTKGIVSGGLTDQEWAYLHHSEGGKAIAALQQQFIDDGMTKEEAESTVMYLARVANEYRAEEVRNQTRQRSYNEEEAALLQAWNDADKKVMQLEAAGETDTANYQAAVDARDKAQGDWEAYIAQNGRSRSSFANWFSAVGNSLISGAGYLDLASQRLDQMLGATDAVTGMDRLIDYNTSANDPFQRQTAINQAEYQKAFDRAFSKYNDEEKAAKSANIRSNIYQLTESMGQSGVNMLITAMGIPGGLALLGGSAATSTAQEMHAKGYSDSMAIATGLVAGAAEIVTEKYSLDHFISNILEKPLTGLTGKKLIKQIGLNILSQGLAEGSEEGMSDIFNLVGDVILSELKNGGVTAIDNEIQEIIAEARENGQTVTYDEARRRAARNWLMELLRDIGGGAASGGLFGMAGSAFNSVVNHKETKRLAYMAEHLSELTENGGEASLKDVSNTGLDFLAREAKNRGNEKAGEVIQTTITSREEAAKNRKDMIARFMTLAKRANALLDAAGKIGISEEQIVNAVTAEQQADLAKRLEVDEKTFSELRQFIVDANNQRAEEDRAHVTINGNITPNEASTPAGMEEAAAPATEQPVPSAPAAQPTETQPVASQPKTAPAAVENKIVTERAPQAPAKPGSKISRAEARAKAEAVKAAQKQTAATEAPKAKAPPAQAAPAIVETKAEPKVPGKVAPTSDFKPGTLSVFHERGRQLITKAHNDVTSLTDLELTTVISLLDNAGAGKYQIDPGLKAVYDAAVAEKARRAEEASKQKAEASAQKEAEEARKKEIEEYQTARYKAAAEDLKARKAAATEGRTRIIPKSEIEAEKKAAEERKEAERKAAEQRKKASEERRKNNEVLKTALKGRVKSMTDDQLAAQLATETKARATGRARIVQEEIERRAKNPNWQKTDAADARVDSILNDVGTTRDEANRFITEELGVEGGLDNPYVHIVGSDAKSVKMARRDYVLHGGKKQQFRQPYLLTIAWQGEDGNFTSGSFVVSNGKISADGLSAYYDAQAKLEQQSTPFTVDEEVELPDHAVINDDEESPVITGSSDPLGIRSTFKGKDGKDYRLIPQTDELGMPVRDEEGNPQTIKQPNYAFDIDKMHERRETAAKLAKENGEKLVPFELELRDDTRRELRDEFFHALSRMNDFFTSEKGLDRFYDIYNLLFNKKPISRRAKAIVKSGIINRELAFRSEAVKAAKEYDSLSEEQKSQLLEEWKKEYAADIERFGLTPEQVYVLQAADLSRENWEEESSRRKTAEKPKREKGAAITSEENLADAERVIPDLRSYYLNSRRAEFTPSEFSFKETPSLKGLKTESAALHRVLSQMTLKQLQEAYEADKPKSEKAKAPKRLADIQWWIDYRQMQKDQLEKRTHRNPKYSRKDLPGEVMLSEQVRNMSDEELVDALTIAEDTVTDNPYSWGDLTENQRNLLRARLDEAAMENRYRRMEQNEESSARQNFKGEARDELRDEDTSVLTRNSRRGNSELQNKSAYSPKATAQAEIKDRYNPKGKTDAKTRARVAVANVHWILTHPHEATFSYEAAGDSASEFEDAVNATRTTNVGEEDVYSAVENYLENLNDETLFAIIDGINDNAFAEGNDEEKVDGFSTEDMEALSDFMLTHFTFEAYEKAYDTKNDKTTPQRAMRRLARESKNLQELRAKLADKDTTSRNVLYKLVQALKSGEIEETADIKRLGGLKALKVAVEDVYNLNAGAVNAFYKNRKSVQDKSAVMTVDENGDFVFPAAHSDHGKSNITDVPVSYKLLNSKGNIVNVEGFVVNSNKATSGRMIGVREVRDQGTFGNAIVKWAVDDLETGHTLGTFKSKEEALQNISRLVKTYAARYNEKSETRADYEGATMAIAEAYMAEKGATSDAARSETAGNNRNLGRQKRNLLWDLVTNPQSAGMAQQTQGNVAGGEGESAGRVRPESRRSIDEDAGSKAQRLSRAELQSMSALDRFMLTGRSKAQSIDYEKSTGAKTVGKSGNFFVNYTEEQNGKKEWYVFDKNTCERTFISENGEILSEEDLNKLEYADAKEAMEVLAGIGRHATFASKLFASGKGKSGGFVYPNSYEDLFVAISNRFKGSAKHEPGHSLLDEIEARYGKKYRRRFLDDFADEVDRYGDSINDNGFLRYALKGVGRTYDIDMSSVDGYYQALEELFVDVNAQGSAWGIVDGGLLNYINGLETSTFDRVVHRALYGRYSSENIQRFKDWYKTPNNEQVAGDAEIVSGRGRSSARHEIVSDSAKPFEADTKTYPFGEIDSNNKNALPDLIDYADEVGTMDFALGYGADHYDNQGVTKEVIGPDGKRTEQPLALEDDDAYKRAVHTFSEFQKKYVDVIYGRLTPEEFGQWFVSRKGRDGAVFYDDVAAAAWDEVLKLGEKMKTEPRYGKLGDSSYTGNLRYNRAISNAIKITARRVQRRSNANKLQSMLEKAARENKFKNPEGGTLKLVLRMAEALQLNPDTFFKLVGGFKGTGAAYRLANSVNNNTAEENKIFAEAQARFAPIMKKKGFFEFAAEKDGRVKVGNVELSQMKLVHLIKLLDTLSATSSTGTGARIFNVRDFALLDRKGQIAEKISLQDIVGGGLSSAQDAIDARNELYKKLSPIAKEYMTACEEAFESLKGKIDATYYDINGIKLASYGKGLYVPVEYMNEQKASNSEQAAYRLGILDQSFTHAREKTSGGTVVIKPMSSVIDAYIGDASKYVAWANMADQLKMMEDGGGHFASSLSSFIGENFGKPFSNYIKDYVNDLGNFSTSENSNDKLLNNIIRKARQNLQTGALMLSLSTPIKQISSYWSAAGIVDMDILTAAYRYKFVSGEKTGAAKNPLIIARKIGGIDPTLSEILNNDTLWNRLKNKSKVVNTLSKAIPFMDVNTVSALYSACVMQVARDNPGVKKGGTFFNSLVESKFIDVVTQTQPIYNRNARSALMRSSNELLKSLAMFRTQQTQNLNRLMTTYGEYRAAQGTSSEKEATDVFRRTFSGQVAAAISYAVLDVAKDLIYHKLWKYKDKDEDEELSRKKILARLAMNTAETFAGNALLGDLLMKYCIDFASRGKTSESKYGISLGPIDTVQSILNGAREVFKDPTLNNAKKLAFDISTLSGLPSGNAYNVVNGLLAWGNSIVRKAGYDIPAWDDLISQMDKQLLPENRFYRAYTRGNTRAANNAYDAMLDKYGSDAASKLRSSVLRPGLRSGDLSERQAENLLVRYTGMDREDAVKAVDQYQLENIREDYRNNAITRSEAENLLVSAIGLKQEEAEKRVENYTLKMEAGEDSEVYSQITDAFAHDYYEYIEPAGISLEDWGRYSEAINKIESDYDDNGDAISGSKNKKLIDFINHQLLTEEQKATIFLATTDSSSFADDAETLSRAGVSLAKWYNIYSNVSLISADKDSEGKTITNSKNTKIVVYLNGAVKDVNQRAEIFYTLLSSDSSFVTKWGGMKAAGFTKGEWYKLYTETLNFHSIKDNNGKTVESKQEQWIKYLASSGLSDAQRRYIWVNVCGYAESKYPWK